jgi:hypothetical protein
VSSEAWEDLGNRHVEHKPNETVKAEVLYWVIDPYRPTTCTISGPFGLLDAAEHGNIPAKDGVAARIRHKKGLKHLVHVKKVTVL